MKVAFVYDRVNKFGGAERVLLALHEIWPDAPLYTAIYDQVKAPWANGFRVVPSFISKIPFINNRHEILPLLTPYAFESFDFSGFDVVISVTSGDAKAIITKPGTMHICYCLTPTRYLWSGYYDYLDQPGLGKLNNLARAAIRIFSNKLRNWDYLASKRPDSYIAISKTVAKRIKSYYRKESIIVYPPVDTDIFKIQRFKDSKLKDINLKLKEKYFLIVSRLVPYKKIDYAISVFNKLGWKLKIIGSGIDESRLKKLAKPNIEFIDGNLTDRKLCWYYQNCRALIYPGVEDFGLTAIESLACGKPVLAYNVGGVAENISAGKTGELYDEQTENALISALKRFEKRRYSEVECRQRALFFSRKKFRFMIKKEVGLLWKKFKQNL